MVVSMRWLLSVFTFLCMKYSEASNPRAIILQNFMDSNKEAVKNLKDDNVLSKALVKTFGLNSSSSSSLSDESSSNLVLMDSTTPCDSGWTKSTVNGMCYKIATADTTWYAAEDWCYSQRYGSHLTSVHSEAEAQWIAATYVSTGWFPYMDNWLGLRRSCDNSTYIWTDGTPVDYLWWQPGYPGSGDPEKSCVTIWVTSLLKLNPGYVQGQFDDIWDCGTNLATPTCRYDPTSTAPHIKYDTSYTCASTTTVSTTSTVTTTKPTTTTTTPTTTTTTPTTTTTTPTTTPTTTTTTPTTTTTESTTTETTSTTTPTTTTTAPTTTTTASTTTFKTTTITTTTQTTTPTTTATTTKPTTTTPTTTRTPVDCSAKCDPFWVSYSDGCYAKIQGTATFETAKLGCQSVGGEMAVITDAAMNEAIRLAFSTNIDSSVSNQAWIGTSSYSNWAPGKPDKAQGVAYSSYCNVIALSVVNKGKDFGFSRGVWTDYPCSLKQEFAICKRI
ncbi:C-type lectin domain-containing protein [Caenorhabditis elegans]|uniref:C-type lectin domain-containing protein n=1 Tax=Caenorhabditis elegans TaxID=6239 RepID=Q9XUF4_CAEEL|nr:C-type lectin domain-containing protein [Caenorhabditis elegans]CAB05164.3 C-type lectin domain-containing protein [Caenorhabditis elegans]|eukprot:NP_503091.3 C-type LECtin [Caenorhabditis elegans]